MSVHHPTTLVCKDVVELVTELLDDALDPVSRARIEQHLLVCPPCTIHIAQVRRTIELAGDLGRSGASASPAPVSASLLDAFRNATRGGS